MKKRQLVLILSSLLFGSYANAIVSGDYAEGGRGTVSISGLVKSNTCSISVDNKEQNFSLTKTAWDEAEMGSEPIHMLTKVSFLNCEGQKLTLEITPKANDRYYGKFDDIGSGAVAWQLYLKDALNLAVEDTPGTPIDSEHFVDFVAPKAYPLTPEASNSSLVVKTAVLKRLQEPWEAKVGDRLVSSYTYKVSYQ